MGNNLFLASKSPRRLQLLVDSGFDVTVIASHAHTLRAFEGDEVPLHGEAPETYALRIARTKFFEGLSQRATHYPTSQDVPVLAADTVVSEDEIIFGKPANAHEAHAFLRALSGKTHYVRTAVVVGTNELDFTSTVQTSAVTFRKITEDEIAAYIATDEPYDKAGGYGIQGVGGIFISHLEGSYTGVMGLPIFEAAQLLSQFGCTPYMQKKA